jgi:hypothetical protein
MSFALEVQRQALHTKKSFKGKSKQKREMNRDKNFNIQGHFVQLETE